LIVLWFYKAAERLVLPSLAWVVGGVLVYYAGFAAWMYLLLRPMLGERFQSHGLWLGLGVDISSVLFGVALTAIFKTRIMDRRGQPPCPSSY
jgi:hypothetical protein